MSKILIAMSGGVDSSVTAYMLKEQGHECHGCTMKLYDSSSDTDELCSNKTCCALSDVEDARSVAYRLGMKFFVFNFKEEFKEYVISPFIDSYLNGKTPNPCIECNRHMKFGKFFERARALGYEDIATGHYARIEFENGKYRLKKALDPTKDQSYVLYAMTQEQLAHTHFPLGNMTKADARKIAEAQGFVNAKKHDSQDICFVPDGDYAKVIAEYRGNVAIPGDFTDKDGNFIARHKGIIHYTIGQRRGLGVPAESRLYVLNVDPKENKVILGNNEDLFSDTIHINNINMIDDENVPETFRCMAKIRYRHKEQPCRVHYSNNNEATIVFDTPQRAITPGQIAVLYDGDTVLGGGTII